MPYLYVINVFLFGYALFCNLLGFFYSAPEKFYAEELYWPFALLLLLAAFYRNEKHFIASFSFSDFIRKHADTLGVLTVVLLLRAHLINDVEIWLDEDYQAHSALINRALIAGAFQHQPPLDMTFTKIGTLFSNEKIWGLRFHSAVFSSLASALLYSLGKKFSKSSFIALILTFFFTLHFIVIQYGYEARPISLGLFYGFSFFGIILSLLIEKKDSFYFKTPLFVSVVTFLFLNSLGLQPVVLTGITTAVLTIYSFVKNEWFKKSLLAVFLGFGLFLPIQVYILKYSPPRFTKHSGFDAASFIRELMDYSNYKIVETYLWPLGYLFLVFCVLYFVFCMFRRRSVSSSVLLLFTTVAGFPLFLVPFFKSQIDWPLYSRYFALLLVPVFLGASVSLKIALETFKAFKNRPWLRHVVIAVFFGIVSFSFNWGPLTGLSDVYKQFQIKKAYEVLNENSSDQDIDLTLCLNVQPWCADSLVMQSFYYKKATGGLVTNWNNSILTTYEKALNDKRQVNNIFLFYYWVWSDNHLSLDGSQLLASLRGVDVLKIAVKDGNLPKTMIDFCVPVVERGLRDGLLYTGPVEYIVASASALGLKDLKNHYLTLYKNFAGRKNNSAYLNSISEP